MQIFQSKSGLIAVGLPAIGAAILIASCGWNGFWLVVVIVGAIALPLIWFSALIDFGYDLEDARRERENRKWAAEQERERVEQMLSGVEPGSEKYWSFLEKMGDK